MRIESFNRGDSFAFSSGNSGLLSPTLIRQQVSSNSGSFGPALQSARETFGYELSQDIGIQGRPAYNGNDYHLRWDEYNSPNLPPALRILPSNTLFRPGDDGVELVAGGSGGSLTENERGVIRLETWNNNRTGETLFIPSGNGLTEQSTELEYDTASRDDRQLRKETFTLRRPDGTGESSQTVRDRSGEFRTTYESNTVLTESGSLLTRREDYDPRGRVKEHSITERSGPEQEADYTSVTYLGSGTSEILEQSSRTTDSRGTVTETETVDRPGRTVESLKMTDSDGNVSGKRVEITPIQNPNIDVEGIAMFGDNNPQRIMRRMGRRDEITATRVRQETYTNNGTIKTDSTVYQNADGTRELERIKSSNGGLAWEYREQGEDGLVDSQLFFQGTKDTVVTDRSRDGNWEVTRTVARTPSLAKETEGAPSYEETEVRRGEGVTSAEIREFFNDPTGAGLQTTEAFRDFMSGVDDTRGATVAFVDSEKTTDGKTRDFRSFSMTDSNGRQLRGVYDQEASAYSLQLQDQDGTVLKGGVAVERGEKVETRDYTREELVNALPTATVVEDVFGLHNTPDAVANVLEFKSVSRGAAFLFATSPEKVQSFGKAAGQLGNATGGALNALSFADALAHGDAQASTKALGGLATDVAATGVRSSVPGARAIYRQNFRALGGAGLALQSMDVIRDFRDGRNLRAAAGGLGVMGTATALFSPLKFAGPIGWGLSLLGTAGVWAWDYNQANRVADLSSIF